MSPSLIMPSTPYLNTDVDYTPTSRKSSVQSMSKPDFMPGGLLID